MFKKKCWKKFGCMILCFLFVLQIPSRTVSASEYWPEAPALQSPAVILMETSTGTILYEHNSLEKNYPASITKIMTTLVALENSDLNEIVTFSDDSINKTEGSGISRDYGEQMTMEQCLYAVMLNSANECAYAVAEHIGGDVDSFVAMMNQKAKEIGCTGTNFVNPHGLFDENHYTNCYDMALIAKAAYENETFRIITGTARYTIPPTNKHEEQTPLQNHNEMLYPWQTFRYRYDYCTGGKTGYTDVARSTLVTYAEKDGMTLVCVVMRTESPNQWLDSISLFDYGFDNFQILNIVDHETKYESPEAVESGALSGHRAFVELDEGANIVLPKTIEFSEASSAIIYEEVNETIVGTISYTYAGRKVGSADIQKADVVIEPFEFENQKPADEETQQIPDTESVGGEEPTSKILIKPQMIFKMIGVLVLLAVLFLIGRKFAENYYIIRHNMEVKKNRRQQYREVKRRNRRRRRK